MANYDYKAGKQRVKDILNNSLDILNNKRLPNDTNFTFDNAYKSWVSAIFVDIRDSSELFSNEDEKMVSKVIRSFTSEVIEILRGEDNLREIGIRGDCVYACYTTPSKTDELEIYNKSVWINTFMEMLNKLLAEKKYPTISVGIGVATGQDLVVKAGRKDTGINNKVWIGKAVVNASNLSGLGNKKGRNSIVFSSSSYNNFIEDVIKASGEESKNWFKEEYLMGYGTFYHASIIESDFYKWVKDGMKD